MKNDGWVKWYQYGEEGMINFGQMTLGDVGNELAKFRKLAVGALAASEEDHVVYGLKVYAEDGSLDCVKFYLKPMSDEEFQKDVATLKNCVVYAVHKR